HGLDTVQRLAERSYTITPEDSQRVDDAQRAYDAAQQSTGALFVQRHKASLETDGGEVRQRLDDRRAFRAQLAHDRDRLYVRYYVQSPAPLVNAVDDPQLIFTGGNLMDVQLSTDAQADPERDAPAPGDVRLLIGRRDDGEPIAVLYQSKRENGGEPIVLRSPTGEESFAAIEMLDDIDLVHEAEDDGFTVTASVPLVALDWKPAAGEVLRGDVGYIFGNATGTRAETRRYWRNNSFTANVTDDIPHESRLEPAEWGTMIVE
ncbi:MAG: hypothetical protein ACOC9P_01870, partial [bacterium]